MGGKSPGLIECKVIIKATVNKILFDRGIYL